MWSVICIGAVAGGIGVAIVADGKDDPAVVACEIALKAQLKSPKSYERVKSEINQNLVLITYDAVNSFNAPVRGEKLCYFDLDADGGFIFSTNAKTIFDDKMAELYARLEKLKSSGATEAEKDQLKKEGEEALTAVNAQVGAVMLDIASIAGSEWHSIKPNTTKLIAPVK